MGWQTESISFLTPDHYFIRNINNPYLIKNTEIQNKKNNLKKNILVIGDSFSQ